MNKSLLFLPLVFLLGCASKPKVIRCYGDGCLEDMSSWTYSEGPSSGLRWATQAQWEAAQGLYNPHLNGVGTYYGGSLPIESPPIDDTGNAWINIDGVNPRKATISCSKGYHLIFHPDTNTICCTPDDHPSDIHHFETFPPSGDAK